jgi:deoxyribodipyrimidine photo-lyase
VRSGPPLQELTRLVRETGAQTIYATADHSPYARQRDARVAAALPVEYVDGPTLRHPTDVLKADGKPYKVFGPYRRKWRSLPLDIGDPLPPPSILRTPSVGTGADLSGCQHGVSRALLEPSERAARARLSAFVAGEQQGILGYAERRDRLDLDGTSVLSPYLRFGLLSAREVVRAALLVRAAAPDADAASGADSWLDELVWREFFVAILYHYPGVLAHSFRPNTRLIAWRDDEDGYQAWCHGQTGYPAVDAAMRQLTAEGWLHNRARMIAASFLVKDLLVDWRRGERFFRSQLLDGDPAANNGNWQWVAGTGTDAVPHFRIFNPVLQSSRHDPSGSWVRRWVPELEGVPGRFLHEPWAMDAATQLRSGCVLGRDYPNPVVDHAAARDRALAAYRDARRAQQL